MLRLGQSFTLAWALIFATELTGLGQGKPQAAAGTVVDVVGLKSGKTLRGAIAWQEPNAPLTMAVSRIWLNATDRQLYQTALQQNLDQRQDAWIDTQKRIEEWQQKAAGMPQLNFFLKTEKERLAKLIAKPDPELPGFLWVDVPNEKIAKISRASADQVKIALFAWNEALPQVETRTPGVLSKELNGKGVKLDGPQPDLYDWLSPRPQKDAEWTARTALVEYSLVKPLDYQGTAGTFIRTGDGQPLNLNEIVPQLMQSQIGSLLKDLNLNGTTKPQETRPWYKPAIDLAEAAKSRGFRVTQVTVDPSSFRATVESRFLVQISAGHWKTAWKFVAVEDGTKARPQLEARIEQDPQLKSVTETIKSLGLNSSTVLQQAIRFGAATMAAQETVDGAFGEFRERFSRQLDGPPLRFPGDD